MLEPRSPIVTILGHVDHGKTTLLDALRKTNVATREAGGITQSIGASVVTTKEGRGITFIDTPGHAAFKQMRSRGAQVCDIAVLIVAADDGVKPQTKEALEIIVAEKLPLLVCVTKTDLPSSDPDTVITQLEKEGILFEGSGGNTPLIKVSEKKNEGLEPLMEMIVLLSDMGEIKADSEADLDAFVVETRRDKRGSMASVIVRNGKLEVGEKILIDGEVSKVRGLFNSFNRPIREVLPGEPALVLGFEKMPPIGAKITGLKDELLDKHKTSSTKETATPTDANLVKLNIVVKAQTSGSLEALLSNLPSPVGVIASGVGDVIEADVFAAKSASDCRIFAFEVKVPTNIARLAATEGVEIEEFNIIYKFFERIDEVLKQGIEKEMGRAEIIASFPYENRKVAGCKMLKGRIGKEDNLKLERNGETLASAKIASLRKEKKDITEVKQGEEFGIILKPQLDFTIGDMLVSVSL